LERGQPPQKVPIFGGQNKKGTQKRKTDIEARRDALNKKQHSGELIWEEKKNNGVKKKGGRGKE